MKIDNSGVIISQTTGKTESAKSQQPQTTNSDTPQQITKTGPVDLVTLTAAATRMQQLEQTIKDTPIVDSHRVERAQQVVSAGSMSIEPNQLAAKILSFEGALNRSRNGV